MKIYIAGPMRGISNYNFVSFFLAEAMMTMKGHDVINPAKMDIEEGKAHWNPVEQRINCSPDFTMHDALRRDFLAMCRDREAIVMLSDWNSSEGAKSELHLSKIIGLQAFQYDGDGEFSPLVEVEPCLSSP